MMSNMR